MREDSNLYVNGQQMYELTSRERVAHLDSFFRHPVSVHTVRITRSDTSHAGEKRRFASDVRVVRQSTLDLFRDIPVKNLNISYSPVEHKIDPHAENHKITMTREKLTSRFLSQSTLTASRALAAAMLRG